MWMELVYSWKNGGLKEAVQFVPLTSSDQHFNRRERSGGQFSLLPSFCSTDRWAFTMPSELLMEGSLSLSVTLLLRLILNKMEGQLYLHCKTSALAFQNKCRKNQRMAEDHRYYADFTQRRNAICS